MEAVVIHIVDYGMGNLRSVANAFEFQGCRVHITSSAAELRSAERIVLPGVGAFGEAMEKLRNRELIPVLEDAVLHRHVPFLGICLGMQLLAERGLEHGDHSGLGWIGGTVNPITPSEPNLRVPHVGWNVVQPKSTSILFRDMPAEPTFYFVHSFHLAPTDPRSIAATCHYGEELVVAIERENIFGTQFHPEKSHKSGLRLLNNFLSYRC